MTTDRPMHPAAMRLRSVSSILSGLGSGLDDEKRFILQSLVATIDMVAAEIGPGAGDDEAHAPPAFPDLPHTFRDLFLAMPPGGEVVIRRDREG